MPPRQRKNVAPQQAPASDPPIIYFLKVSKDAQTAKKERNVPIGLSASTEYSDILKEEVTQQQFDESIIHEIVAKIHHQTEYPIGTACFWCCHPFSWKSFICPTHYDVYTNHYTAEGNYCSPSCALAFVYADASLSSSQKWIRHSLLQSMYKDVFVKLKFDLVTAPDKRVLRMFGGTLNIDQYRRYIKEGGAPLQIAMPPVRLYMPSINTQASSRDIKSYVSLTNETVDRASQQLRLKRNKPVHSTIHTLDKCMGINTA
jgi:hypothetical protein